MTAQDNWKQLGKALLRRRIALDPAWAVRSKFAEDTGVGYHLVIDIEGARRVNFGQRVLAQLEVAYKLDPGAIERFLDGGPLVLPESGGQQHQLSAAADADSAEVDLDAVWQEVGDLRRQLAEIRAEMDRRRNGPKRRAG